MDIEDICIIEDIKNLKYRYFRFLDQKRWDDMSTIFAPDATAAYSGGKYEYHGRDAIVEFMSKNMSRDAFHTSHRAHHPEIELIRATSDAVPTEATGVWAFEDTNVDSELDFYLTGAGFYEDRYIYTDGQWLIAHTGYKRTFETIRSMSQTHTALTASWWSTGGQSSLEVS